MADAKTFAHFVEPLLRQGLKRIKAHGDDPAEPVPDVACPGDDAGGRVDMLFAKTPFEREAPAQRVEGMEFARHPRPVVPPEDSIVFKLVAGRSQDIPDARDIIWARTLVGEPLDWPYMERWSRAREVLDRLESLRRESADGPERGGRFWRLFALHAPLRQSFAVQSPRAFATAVSRYSSRECQFK